MLQAPELAAKVQTDQAHSSFSLLSADGKQYREAQSEQYVVKLGIVYWVLEAGTNDVRDVPRSGLQMSGVPTTSAPNVGEKTTGRTLIDVLLPWGLVDPLVRELREEHILYTSLLTSFLADAQLGHDADGPFLVCRFQVEEMAYPLAKEYWNRTVIGGVEIGPLQPLTGTAVHKLWYDPVTFILRKRTITGEFALDGGKTHTLPPVNEVYRPKSASKKK